VRAPAVSVLLPVRDAASTLGVALRSLARQTLCDHEIVAVNDGSSDSSGQILDQASAADGRVRVIHTPKRGLVAALSEALGTSRAPFVARMDADDIAHSDRLRLQHQRLSEDPDLSILGARVRLFGGRDNQGMRRYVAWSNALLSHDDICRDLLVESPFVHPSVMMRASKLIALGGYRELDGPEDYDLWLRAHAAGLRFGKIDAPLLQWRDGPARLTRSDLRYAPARFLDLKVRFLLDGPLRGRPGVVWGAGPLGKAMARAIVRLGGHLEAWAEVAPRRLGARILGVPVLTAAQAALIPDALHLGAVGQPGARSRLRVLASELGLVEGRSFIAVA
jgi:glycosyltransferase involved in cell wall biosynthesis